MMQSMIRSNDDAINDSINDSINITVTRLDLSELFVNDIQSYLFLPFNFDVTTRIL